MMLINEVLDPARVEPASLDGPAKIGLVVRGFVPECSEFHQRECRLATYTRESDTVLSDGFVTVRLDLS